MAVPRRGAPRAPAPLGRAQCTYRIQPTVRIPASYVTHAEMLVHHSEKRWLVTAKYSGSSSAMDLLGTALHVLQG